MICFVVNCCSPPDDNAQSLFRQGRPQGSNSKLLIGFAGRPRSDVCKSGAVCKPPWTQCHTMDEWMGRGCVAKDTGLVHSITIAAAHVSQDNQSTPKPAPMTNKARHISRQHQRPQQRRDLARSSFQHRIRQSLRVPTDTHMQRCQASLAKSILNVLTILSNTTACS